jgi:hypothetical protein
MQAGYQTTGLSFWDHGVMVKGYFEDLMGQRTLTWRLPQWYLTHEDKIKDALRPRMDQLTTYQLWHDLGKPYCRTVDEQGKVHYPDHADVSSHIWRKLGGDPLIADLIERDMLCHQLRPAEAHEFASNPNALALLITALCELHANASMFGGLESESFKIKWKRLDKCGNIILNSIFKE